MRTKTRFLPVLRRAVYVLLFLAVAVIQNTFLGGHGIAVLPLVPLTVAVCTFEGEFAGLFFGLLGGALCDIASPVPDGVFALLFAVLGCAVGLTMHYVFRGTLLSAVLLTLACAAVVLTAAFLFNVFANDPTGAFTVFRRAYLPGIALTTALLPIFYYPVRAADGKLR